MKQEQSRRLVLISHPRTTSNLLLKVLNLDEQPDILQLPLDRKSTHLFLPGIKVRFENGIQAKRVCDWSEEEISTTVQNYKEVLEELDIYASRADKEGKIAFFREHSGALMDPVAQTRFYTGETSVRETWRIETPDRLSAYRSRLNDTLLPDDFMKDWLPTFIIRHPALAFPSFWRVLQASNSTQEERIRDGEIVNTYRWTRSIYDCYSSTFGMDGIILDAEDIIAKPEVLVSYCERVGLDPSKLKFSWNAKYTSEELQQHKNQDPRHHAFMATVDTSSGILKGKAPSHVDIEAEIQKWQEEFDEITCAKLEKWVRAATTDYEYLRSKKLSA
ncbi:hypothetical protein P153DRAFT_386408 [Dothidotthia symphoricarpi CBS 119687]|uniref:Sulfotransferase family protein n=1 Tax=Dothidotthia symphoricarpi CBS 119687 TaxID=1392245 RepID=A0A6A6AC44_9PLEO|nr:uncharacterized protein P153DRAFT_386408 [Dothidotthia symphoricarpi CBS 119687]KAF2128281.1 hypothetical protein P153DRAFT_386408 [Dothidotthia symphoricarpi CBS 119687]